MTLENEMDESRMGEEELLKRFKGAMLGVAVGDMMGAPVEGFSGERAMRFYEERGWKMVAERYTDDTEMMIGVAESLIACRGFNGEHMALQFLRNYDASRGYGPGTTEVFRLLRRSVDLSTGIGRVNWREASRSLFGGEGSYGNGAAMRVAPIGLLYHNDERKLVEVAFEASHITHAHPLAKEGAALLAYAVAIAVRSNAKIAKNERRNSMLNEISEKEKENRENARREEIERRERREKREKTEKLRILNELKRFASRMSFTEYMKKLRKIEELIGNDYAYVNYTDAETRKKVVSALGNGLEALNSVPTAIFSFLCTASFEESIKFAVCLGGDTDTIGAMTGAISGAFYTIDAIPAEWLEHVENQKYIMCLAERLHKLWKEM